MTENIKLKWLLFDEAVEYLRCTAEELREEINKKKVPFSVFKGRKLFNIERLDELLSSAEITQASSDIKPCVSAEEIKIIPNCEHKKVESLIQKLTEYNQGNEIFVNSFGKQLKEDLEKNSYRELRKKTFSRLSHWCHPKKPSPRNNEVKEIAQEISMQLYGKIIERR